MKFLSRVVWSEGMHLGPHHFQTQSRYFEDSLWFLHANARQNPWGLLHYSLRQADASAVLSVAAGILPDGLIFDIPDCDSVPAPANLKNIFKPTDTAIVLYLAIAGRLDRGFNCDVTGGSVPRYGSIQKTLRDEVLGQDEFDVALARKNLRLCSEAELDDTLVAFPLARMLRDGKGGFYADPDFIPPCLRIGASESLMLLLQRLLEAIEDKVVSVRREKRTAATLELGTSALDVANYWFLHCLCTAVPGLRNHLATRLSHPEDVYRDLCRLAGALSTFALESSIGEIPPYRHNDLTSTFRTLEALIRRYLEIVVPSNSIKLAFISAGPFFWNAAVNDERCLRRSKWILGIRSSVAQSTLLRLVPSQVKVCSARGVATLVKRALPGLELLHQSVPPSAMHAQADATYFSVSLNGICWDDILKTRAVGVYIPDELTDANFDLTVITEINP